MKIRLLLCVAALIAVTSIMTSCLDNEVEQITYVSESSITSFSVGTLHIDRIGKDRQGNDSAYVDTIDCSNYPFTIDQFNRTIENKDSFPVGTHIDKVLTSATSDGLLAYRPNGSQNDTVWTSTDSIDFTNPLEFRVYANSGAVGKAYIVKLNVHKVEPDTIAWTNYEYMTFDGDIRLTQQKTVYADGKLYTFGQNGSTSVVQRTEIGSDSPSAWTSITTPVNIKPYSATAWLDRIYFLSGTGQLYMLDPATDSITPATETADIFDQLLAGNDGQRTLYALKESKSGVLAADGAWTEDTEQLPESISPTQRISSFTEALTYNEHITRTTLLCNSLTGDTAATVYQRLSDENGWMKMIQEQPVPNMSDITMIHYDGQLYAFGGPSLSAESNPNTAFAKFYGSATSGQEWTTVTNCLYFPSTFAAWYTRNEGNYSAAVNPPTDFTRGNFIWIVWENGNISRGRINRLGFNPKW